MDLLYDASSRYYKNLIIWNPNKFILVKDAVKIWDKIREDVIYIKDMGKIIIKYH